MQDIDEGMDEFLNKNIKQESLPAKESTTKPSPIKCEPRDYCEDSLHEQPPKIKVEPVPKIKTDQPIATSTTLKVKNENKNVLFENKPLDFGMTPEQISCAMKSELGSIKEEEVKGQRIALKSTKKSVFHKERPYEKQKVPGKER